MWSLCRFIFLEVTLIIKIIFIDDAITHLHLFSIIVNFTFLIHFINDIAQTEAGAASFSRLLLTFMVLPANQM